MQKVDINVSLYEFSIDTSRNFKNYAAYYVVENNGQAEVIFSLQIALVFVNLYIVVKNCIYIIVIINIRKETKLSQSKLSA